MSSATPDLFQVITEIVRWQLAELNTAIPARVLSYDPATQSADVQPLLKRRLKNGQVLSRAAITGVPVVFPAAGGGIITFPIQAGDTVLLIFSQRSIDRWVQSDGGEVDPLDNRMHAISDAIAIPGLTSFPNALSGDTDRVIIKFQGAQIALARDGSVEILAPGGLHVVGNVTVTGTITADGTVIGDGVNLKTHTHPGVQVGGSNTGAPN
jgi:hypothetical protein